ncbi:MAG: hypothetical protein MUC43_00195 [Pirellula sp.]|nr:hypothetical protein [Pirellula sp.]
MNVLVDAPETELLDVPCGVQFESEPSDECEPTDGELSVILCPLTVEAGVTKRTVIGVDADEVDWFELALQTEAPIPVRSAWDDDDDDVEDEPVEDDDEVTPDSGEEADPFDDFDEDDFDDDFDDDFEEELDDEYEIEPKDDGFPVEADDDEDVDPDLLDDPGTLDDV